jgi:hypothetical protein
MDEDDRLPTRVALLGVVDLRAGGKPHGRKPKRWTGVLHGCPS